LAWGIALSQPLVHDFNYLSYAASVLGFYLFSQLPSTCVYCSLLVHFSPLTRDKYAQGLPENKARFQGNCGKPFAAAAYDLCRGTKRARRRGTC